MSYQIKYAGTIYEQTLPNIINIAAYVTDNSQESKLC